MTTLQALPPSVVDVVFPVLGHSLLRDHGQALQQALCAQWPWLNADTHAGIHPIKLVPGSEPIALLSRRSTLLLRVSRQRADELMALPGLNLSVSGHPFDLGTPHLRELIPHATLYAYKVAASSADEIDFMAAVSLALTELAIGGERVCGKRHHMACSSGELNTFSLMLHALPPEQSVRLQQHGIGPHRLLGCGIFVPHKSAAAV